MDYRDNDTVREMDPKHRAIWDEIFVCFEEIDSIIRKGLTRSGLSQSFYPVKVAAYLLSIVSSYNNPFGVSFEDLIEADIDRQVLDLAKRYGIDQVWPDLLELILRHPGSIFEMVSLLDKMDDSAFTPVGITDLATELLEVKPGERVADYCCGAGAFAYLQKKLVPEADVTGYDSNEETVVIASIKENLSKDAPQIKYADVFSLAVQNTAPVKFDKIFADYPFGQRKQDQGLEREYQEMLRERIPSISRATSSDWIYNMLIVDTLKEDGKAVAVMTNGSTWNMIDAPIREYFVRNGLIECVISLPAKLFYRTNIATSMIVFSHGNKGIRLVDASEVYHAGRRVNELTESDVELILEACREDGKISTFVYEDNLRANHYVLNKSRYNNSWDRVDDGVPFESVIKRITRGAPLKAKDLDQLSSPVPTNVQYLMLANIHDGLIDENLPYLSEIGQKVERYCISNHCLILSKNGYPYKVAVAEFDEGKKILANGNLYIIELDEAKINPYYLAAYLSSQQGTDALKSITVGATIPNIGVEQLKQLIIPVPAMKEQERIAGQYQEIKDEISLLQMKLDEAKKRMNSIIGKGL